MSETSFSQDSVFTNQALNISSPEKPPLLASCLGATGLHGDKRYLSKPALWLRADGNVNREDL